MNKIQRTLFTFVTALVVIMAQAGTVTVLETSHGTVTAKVSDTEISTSTEHTASADQAGGTTIMLEISPDANYYLYSLRVEPYASGDQSSAPRRTSGGPTMLSTVAITKVTDTKYKFIMPSYNVKVISEFRLSGDLGSATINLAHISEEYNWLAHTPVISSVKVGNDVLAEGTDYIVSHKRVGTDDTWDDGVGSFTNAGTYTIKVTGIGKYHGSKTETFTITPRTITGATITLSENSFVYKKSTKQIPDISGVFLQGQTLVSGTDYEDIEYSSDGTTYTTYDAIASQDAGTYYVRIKGKGNFSGTTYATTTYKINKKELSLCTVVTDPVDASFIYDGTVKTLGVTLNDKNNNLEEGAGKDYVLSGNTATAVGGYNATLTANEINYTGSIKVPYTINVSNDGYYIVFDDVTYTPTFSTTHSETYTGGQIELTPGTNIYVKKKANPTASPQSSDQVLSSTYYTLVYNNNINVGTATVTAIGRGGYDFMTSKTFAIVKKSISGVTFTLTNTSLTYNTSEQKPTVTVKDGTRDLVEGTDYTFSGQTNAGTYTVTITGIGNYKETATSASMNSTNSVYQYTINKLPLAGAAITLGTTDYVLMEIRKRLPYNR